MEPQGGREYSARSFGETLAGLLREHQGNELRVSLLAFAEELEGVGYNALRFAVMGKVYPKTALMEEVARVLGVSPTIFREYRMIKILEAVETHPELAGEVYEFVMAHAAAIEEAVGSKRVVRVRPGGLSYGSKDAPTEPGTRSRRESGQTKFCLVSGEACLLPPVEIDLG